MTDVQRIFSVLPRLSACTCVGWEFESGKPFDFVPKKSTGTALKVTFLVWEIAKAPSDAKEKLSAPWRSWRFNIEIMVCTGMMRQAFEPGYVHRSRGWMDSEFREE